MLIALLVVLGVDLIVVVVIGALVFGRKRWLKRQPGEFAGAVRVTSGDIDGLNPNWKRGSGRWVRDVLGWNKAPFLYRTDLVPTNQLTQQRQGAAGELKHLGDQPVIAAFTSDTATIEVAPSDQRRALLLGPWSTSSDP